MVHPSFDHYGNKADRAHRHHELINTLLPSFMLIFMAVQLTAVLVGNVAHIRRQESADQSEHGLAHLLSHLGIIPIDAVDV